MVQILGKCVFVTEGNESVERAICGEGPYVPLLRDVWSELLVKY